MPATPHVEKHFTASGAIAMGLGGYLAARTGAEHYAAEEQRELNFISVTA